MNPIKVLDSQTINKIAAGEVVERPASVVKELVENAMDAGASGITVEIKDGGIKMIRVTDNGCGMDKEALAMCFERHATSKISGEDDLKSITSLGFRGEALSSIASVSIVETMTRQKDELVGHRLYMEGGKNPEIQEVGLPEGTTMIVRNLFFNTPARKKFLRSAMAEMNTITDLMTHLALSRPDISFSYITNHQTRFHTVGNGQLRDAVYEVYGRDIAKALIPVYGKDPETGTEVSGFLGRPELVRGSRSYETYFLNGRYIKSDKFAVAIEEGCREFLMQHKFPFCVLHITIDPFKVDVNVHPTKMEVRLDESLNITGIITAAVEQAMHSSELLQRGLDEEKTEKKPVSSLSPEPFEKNRIIQVQAAESKPANGIWEKFKENEIYAAESVKDYFEETSNKPLSVSEEAVEYEYKQQDLFEDKILSTEKKADYCYIGQLFDTYWLIQWKDQFLMIDQHAAHEKIKYERLMKQFREKMVLTQLLNPPIIISLTGEEEETLHENQSYFEDLGFRIDEFGGREYALREVPVDLYGYKEREMFLEVLDELALKGGVKTPEAITSRIATMACKAAVKGNNSLSVQEAKVLIDELLGLDNPYNCPHGRPTAIVMSKYEVERKFKRVVD